ncbi:MAG: maleylpyruvate isomerase N-terminal domain-containing protein [Acidimicrobiales bacterium]
MTDDQAPLDDIARVADAHTRLDRVIAGLSDAEARSPSRLPGWSIGHLLTHVARNADSHHWRTRGALAGEVVDQYPGGAAERSGAIDAGADRSAVELIDDVRATSAAVDAAWADVPAAAWANLTRDLSGRERPLSELPGRRWLEVEIHLIDVGRPGDPTHRDWSDDFVSAWLPHQRAGLEARLPEGAAPPGPGSLDPRDELAWLVGRFDRPDLPTLGPW